MKIKRIIEDFEPIDKSLIDSENELEEDVLNEVGLKDIVRGIRNKFDPDGAIDRGVRNSRGADRSKLNKMTNNAKRQIAKELESSQAKNYKFYLPGSKDPMDWETYKEFVQRDNLTEDDWNNIFNAIVVDRNDYFIRRGPENLDKENLRYYRGKNDALKYKWQGGKNGQAVWVKENADMPSGDSEETDKPTFTVTAQLPTGANIIPVEGYTQQVAEGGEFKFTVGIEDTFIKNPDKFKVSVNGKDLTPDDKGVYTISGIKEDQKIVVEGVEEKPTDTEDDKPFPPSDDDEDDKPVPPSDEDETPSDDSDDTPSGDDSDDTPPSDEDDKAADDTDDKDPPKKDEEDEDETPGENNDEEETPKVKFPKNFPGLIDAIGGTIYLKKNGKILKPAELKQINKDNMADYLIKYRHDKKPVELPRWLQHMQKVSMFESWCKKYGSEELNEDILTEAPIIQLDDVAMNNPDSISLKKIASDVAERERLAKEAEEKAARRQELMTAYSHLLTSIKPRLEAGEKPSDVLEILFEELVPHQGMCETVAGELVRAIMRILYRDYNDGDKFFEGYGLETCGGSAQYLAELIPECSTIIDNMLEEVFKYVDDDEAYTDKIESLAKAVLLHIVDNPELLAEPNEIDSREYDSDYIEAHEPRYEFELSVSDDLDRLIDEHIIDSWKLKEYVESNLEYESCFEGAEVDRPWGQYDHSVSISNLTKEGLERFEEWERRLDHFWEDLVSEYADELAELDADDESEDDDDEYDEYDDSIDEDYYLRSGDESMSGWINNLTDKDIDSNLKDYNRIARLLKLKDPKDLIIYVDAEGMYDPCQYDSYHYTLTETPIKFEVRNIPVVARLENGNIVLYFASEAQATKYLTFFDNIYNSED